MIALLLLLVGIGCLIGGVVLLRRNGPGWRVGRLLSAAPRRSLGEALALAAAGEETYVRVHGRIDSEEEFPDEDDRPIVFRRRRLQRRDGRGNWTTFDDERLAVPFRLTERGDAVAVDADALGDGLVVVPRISEGTAADLPSDVSREPLPDLPAESPVRLRIDQVSSVEHATAVGVPTLDADGTTVLTSGLGRPLILTTLDIEEAMRVLGSEQRGSIILATGLLVAAAVSVAIAIGAAFLGL
jgi:hypothetical protein